MSFVDWPVYVHSYMDTFLLCLLSFLFIKNFFLLFIDMCTLITLQLDIKFSHLFKKNLKTTNNKHQLNNLPPPTKKMCEFTI